MSCSSLGLHFNYVCFDAVNIETDVGGRLQVVAVATQTDEDVSAREHWLHVSIAEIIYQFLAQTTDIKRNNLIGQLAVKGILLPAEKQKLKKQEKTDAKVVCLLMTLKEKSADQFERFLSTLGETGQQSVADVVRQALHTVGQTGLNPLHYARGMTV